MYHPDDCRAIGLDFHPVAAGRFDGRGDLRDWLLQPEHLVVSLVDRGTAIERVAWGSYTARTGEVTVLWPGRWHALTEQGGRPLATWWIAIDAPRLATRADSLAQALGATEDSPVVRPVDAPAARRLFSDLVAAITAAEALPPTHFYERFFAVAQLCGGGGWRAPARGEPSLIARAEVLWQHEAYGALGPAALAARLGVHPNTLLAAARAERGVTTAQLVRSWKVERARGLLEGSATAGRAPLKLAAIAAASGFASPSHFIRAFRQVTGRNPGSYRAEGARPALKRR